MHDLIIRGGTIADGSGQPTRTGDIAIDGSIVTAVGDVEGPARRASTPTAFSSRRAGSTSTPTTTARPPGTRRFHRRAGTG